MERRDRKFEMKRALVGFVLKRGEQQCTPAFNIRRPRANMNFSRVSATLIDWLTNGLGYVDGKIHYAVYYDEGSAKSTTTTRALSLSLSLSPSLSSIAVANNCEIGGEPRAPCNYTALTLFNLLTRRCHFN